MSAPKLDRIAIVMMSALGDAVHVLPVLNAIKRHAPASRITWVLQPGGASLVRGHPSVDDIVVFPRSKGWRAFEGVRRELRRREFDLALNLQVYLKAGFVTSFVRAPVKLGFDRRRARDLNWMFTNRKIPARPNQHVQDQYFEFLAALGIAAEPVVWNLGPWPEEREWQRRFYANFDRPAAAIVVGTSNPQKDWPADRWAQVAEALRHDFDLEPVLVGGRTERELRTEEVMRTLMRAEPRTTLGCPLRELVGIMDGAALVLSPDTGPMHMAVALDRPVVSLLGYLNPKRVGPYRKFHDLMVDAYGEPGENYPITMEHRPGRMERIQVRDVLDRVELWRTRYAASSGPKA